MCCRCPINKSETKPTFLTYTVWIYSPPHPRHLDLHSFPQKIKSLSCQVNISTKQERRNEIPLILEPSNSINMHNPHLMEYPLKNKNSYYLAGLTGRLKRIVSGLQHQIKTRLRWSPYLSEELPIPRQWCTWSSHRLHQKAGSYLTLPSTPQNQWSKQTLASVQLQQWSRT